MTAAAWARPARAALHEFTELRWVTVQSGRRPFPFQLAPLPAHTH